MTPLNSADTNKALFSGEVASNFRPLFKRTPNFAREFIEIEPDKGSDPTVVRFALGHKGDIATEMILELETAVVGPSSAKFDRPLGEMLMERATLFVGGKVLDKYEREYAKTYDYFFRTDGERNAYSEAASRKIGWNEDRGAGDEEIVYVPLVFCPCRDESRGLPLVAMDESVEVEIELGEVEGVVVSGTKLLVNFSYLDEPERRFFESRPLLYSLDCIQTNAFDIPPGSTELNARLSFSGAVKCIFWNFVGWREGEEALKSASLSMEGVQRFAPRSGKWLRHLVQRGFPNFPPEFANSYAMPFCSRPGDANDAGGQTVFAGLDRVDMRLEMNSPAPEGSEVVFFALSTNLFGVKDGMSRILFGEISSDI
jgi:hypothetical protein